MNEQPTVSTAAPAKPKRIDHIIMLVVGIIFAIVLAIGAYMMYHHTDTL